MPLLPLLPLALLQGAWLFFLAYSLHNSSFSSCPQEQWCGFSPLAGGASTFRGPPTRQSFSQPSQNMPALQRAQFLMGDSLFARSWVFAPSSLQSSDGLGPLFNARACQSCHIKDGRGHLPKSAQDSATSALVKLALFAPSQHTAPFPLANLKPDPAYGMQFHDAAMPSIKPEGKLIIHWQHHLHPSPRAQGPLHLLAKPEIHLSQLGYGALHKHTKKSLRIAPAMIGLGLLEAIPASSILRQADPTDRDGDGVSGRVSWLRGPDPSSFPHGYHMGRFGWKASQSTLMAQNLGAFFQDIGMTSFMHSKPEGDCQAPAQQSCIKAARTAAAKEGSDDISREIADLILFYTRSLAPPQRRIPTDAAARRRLLQGEHLFNEIRCTSCHTPAHRTSSNYPVAHLRDQEIFPYTDLLLHDMGQHLDDGFATPHASSAEWRTPPLWGLGLTQIISPEAGFLHDGRAQTIEEAILWHGGEGAASRRNYEALSSQEKEALISFLLSL